MAEVRVIDVSGLVLGRASTVIAKRLLAGETLAIVNAEKAVVLGKRSVVLSQYRAAEARGSVRKGPHFPRTPERILRRCVRGMLPYKRSTGREAFRRLRTYIGVPEEFTSAKAEVIEVAKPRPALTPPLTLLEISRHLGARV